MKFVEKKPEAPNVYSFIFKPKKPVKWQPGQYLHYELPHPNADDRGISRWFTISAAPYEKHIQLTTRFDTKRSSTFKMALLKLKPGTEIEAGEPRGEFVPEEDAERHIFIAGGIGITPYRSQLTQMDHDGEKLNIDLMYANKDEDFAFGNELTKIANKHPEFRLIPYTGDKRISPSDVQKYIPREDIIFYLSGPRALVENYQTMLEDLGVGADRIKTDYFPGY